MSFWAYRTVAPCWRSAQLATFRIQMRFDCHPSHRQGRAAPRQALGSMGSLVRFMGHNCTSASCGARSGGWPRRSEGQWVLFECCHFVCRLLCVSLCLCVSVGVCLYYTRLTCSTSLSLSLSGSLLLSLSLRSPVCSLACPRASEHPKAKFSLASAKSSELNVSIDSKRHC